MRMNSYHRSQVRVVEDIAIVVDRKRIAIDTKLQKKGKSLCHSLQPCLGGLLRVTSSGGVSFSISLMGTSVPATPRSSAMRTCNKKVCQSCLFSLGIVAAHTVELSLVKTTCQVATTQSL